MRFYLQFSIHNRRRLGWASRKYYSNQGSSTLQQTANMSTDSDARKIINGAFKADLDYLKKLKTLESIGPDHFRTDTLVPGSPLTTNVFGGLIFAQSIVAAEMTVANSFVPHAAHSFFIRKATIEKPIDYVVNRLRDGRSYCTRLVQAHQEGQVVFCSQISLCVPEPSTIEHQVEMPRVPPPEEKTSFFDLARSVLREHEEGKTKLSERVINNLTNTLLHDQIALFEFRPVDPNIFLGLQPHSVLPSLYWLKCTIPLLDCREDRSLNRFLLAYITDATLVSTANRPHLSQGHPASLLLSLDHTVHFHDENFNVDDWLLCENESPMAKNGRAFSLGRIWTRDGRLLLSCCQESLSRSRSQQTSKLSVEQRATER